VNEIMMVEHEITMEEIYGTLAVLHSDPKTAADRAQSVHWNFRFAHAASTYMFNGEYLVSNSKWRFATCRAAVALQVCGLAGDTSATPERKHAFVQLARKLDDTDDDRALAILKYRCLHEMAAHDYLTGPCLQITQAHLTNLKAVLAVAARSK